MVVAVKTGKLQRFTSTDLSIAEEVFKTALVLLVPDDQTQRKAFAALYPYMYVLRNKGCSWVQLTTLLNESGFTLQPSTVRTYYSELLADRLDVSQARMNEQISLMDELRKEMKGVDISAISARVASAMERSKALATGKLDSLFGAVDVSPRGPAPQPQPRQAPRAIAPPQPSREPAGVAGESSGFGLQNPPGGEKKPPGRGSRPPGFIPANEIPQVPDLAAASRQGAAESTSSPPAGTVGGALGRFKCAKLQEGVEPAKRRAELRIPEEVFQPGLLEHPAIPGLLLTLEQRRYGAALEYFADDDVGEITVETMDEKRLRLTWKHRIPASRTNTSDDFVAMDHTLFKKK